MMTHTEALEILAAHRQDQIVITTMGSVAIWPRLSDTERDFAYLPSSMGQAIPLGLGLSLARPGLKVLVLSGDGGLLMNLGCLVTLAQHSVPMTVILIDNGLYEVTGGQPVVGAGKTDFAGIARAAGIPNIYTFDSVPSWRAAVSECLNGTQPTFVWLKVAGELGKATPSAPRPMEEQIRRLQRSLGV